MTPPDSASAPLDPLRRELILAQVQLMELEDTRDDLLTQLAAAQAQLAEAQQLADNALREQEFGASRHAALRDEHERLAATAAGLNAQLADAFTATAAQSSRADALEKQLAIREREGAELAASASAATSRVAQLDAERRGMLASRSWRWTAPLRALERALRRHRGTSA